MTLRLETWRSLGGVGLITSRGLRLAVALLSVSIFRQRYDENKKPFADLTLYYVS